MCLTFDDGPDSLSTLPLLRIIEQYNIKSVFFCTGIAGKKHPGLIERIKSGGHLIGNHGYDHLDGFITPSRQYIENVKAADPFTSDNLFRPPYGHLKPAQYRKLIGSYNLMMWDLMAYDFDTNFGKERSLNILRNKIRAGSIIVLHDKPESTVHSFLDEFITYCFEKGYRFEIPVFPHEPED